MSERSVPSYVCLCGSVIGLEESRCGRCGESIERPDCDGAPIGPLMEAATLGEALSGLGTAARSGYGPTSLVELLDFARVVPSPVLDRLRSEFVVDQPDPYRRVW